MASLARDIRDTFVPDPTGRHGPLPPLLIGLTLVTGLVDSFSYLPLAIAVAVAVAGAVTAYGSGKSDPPWVRTGA